MARQLSFADAALSAWAEAKQVEQLKEKLIIQGIKEVTMHEGGHTLGLRHNFKASAYLSLKDLNDPAKTRETGMTASVMDYTPVNIVPKGMQQGDFFSNTVGPYDLWAIEYGYRPFSGGTSGELSELKKIAARSGEPALAYATDEDCQPKDPDPETNRFDLGDDLVAYGRQKAQLVNQLLPGLVDRMTEQGEDYTQARRAFNVLLAKEAEALYFAARYVGGLNTSRSHKGDRDASPPLAVVDPKKQRQALAFLEEEAFGISSFQFPPDLLNRLGPTRWKHWGSEPTERPDYPLHDMVGKWQDKALGQLLSPLTLERIVDNELKVAPEKDAFTVAELLQRLTRSIFAELEAVQEGEFTNRKPAIGSLRRSLQRKYLRKLSDLVLGTTSVPEDCRSLARAELAGLKQQIEGFLAGPVKLDSYSQAHLTESADRIGKVLDAGLELRKP
jgi:hypothetical protein